MGIRKSKYVYSGSVCTAMLLVVVMISMQVHSKQLSALSDLEESLDGFNPYADINEAEANKQFAKYSAVVEYIEKAKDSDWLHKMSSVCDKVTAPPTENDSESSSEGENRLVSSSQADESS